MDFESVARITPIASRSKLVARVKERILQSVFQLSRIGQRHGWEWLTYHPGVFAFFHWLAKREAPKVIGSLLATFPEARSFADVGAGTGAYAAYLQREGRSVVACERSALGRALARFQRVGATKFDLNRTRPAAFGTAVDIAYCFEVAEHLPPELGTRLVGFILELGPTVVFSAARPGQGGQGHINEQPPSYWAAEFDRAGADLDERATTTLATHLAKRNTVEWIPPNVQVFRRRLTSRAHEQRSF
jgi:SAM-dependent methyltransferase